MRASCSIQLDMLDRGFQSLLGRKHGQQNPASFFAEWPRPSFTLFFFVSTLAEAATRGGGGCRLPVIQQVSFRPSRVKAQVIAEEARLVLTLGLCPLGSLDVFQYDL